MRASAWRSRGLSGMTRPSRRVIHCGRLRTRQQAAPTLDQSSFPACVPAQFIADVSELAALNMAASIELLPVRIKSSPTPLSTSVVRTTAARENSGDTPLVLLHGFDSSLLEFRRLFPLLELANVPAIAVDLVGCGFTGLQSATGATPADRTEHLRALLEQHVGTGRQVDLLGASLGGTASIDFCLQYPALVRDLVLVDAQGFVEGTPQLPGALADVGIGVLRSVWLRQLANKLAYADLRFATDDAMRIGRLHTHLPDWSRSTRSFMDSGGYMVRRRIPEVTSRTLIVHGSDDQIIEPSSAARFSEELPTCELCFIPGCGHVPHLERPHALVDAILRFRRVE